jgi:hypothetical protein
MGSLKESALTWRRNDEFAFSNHTPPERRAINPDRATVQSLSGRAGFRKTSESAFSPDAPRGVTSLKDNA